jgi:anti-anti-sigma factor
LDTDEIALFAGGWLLYFAMAGLAMIDSAKGIAVACTDTEVYVRVAGRGTFQNSQPLRRFALEMIERGYRAFTVDIGACPTMDSTFLGVLAGIGLRLRRDGLGEAGQVRMVNVSARNLELMQTLGLDRLFVVRPAGEQAAPHAPPAGAALQVLSESDLDSQTRPLNKSETTSVMLQAHDSLVKADKRNAPKFSQVTKYLRQTVERPRPDNSEP